MRKLLLLLIVAVFAINLFDIRGSHDWGDDFSGYINQANAIVKHDINHLKEVSDERVALSEFQVGPSLYPWGYPLILAIAILFFGMNLVILKLFTYFFFIGSAVVFYFLIKHHLPKNMALLLVLIFSLSPFFFSFKQEILSDFPAMFFLLLSLLLIQTVYERDLEAKKKKIHLVALGAAMFLSYFVRTSSIVILPTLFLVQLVNWKGCFKNRRSIIESLIPYAAFLIMYVGAKIVLLNSSYSENITLFPPDFLNSILSNARYYSTLIIEFFGNPTDILPQAIYFMTIPFLIFGIISGFKKNYIFIMYGALTMGLYLLFPHRQGLRFIMSLIPVYLYFVFLGFKSISFENISNLNYKKFAGAIGFLLIAFFAVQNYPKLKGPWLPDGPYTQKSAELFQCVEKNTKNTDLLAFFKPRALYLMTGRRSIWIVTPKTLESNTSADYYIYTDVYDDVALKNYLDQNKKLVFENEKFWMYKMK